MIREQWIGLGVWLAIGIAFCFAVASLVRSRSSRSLWMIWVACLVGLVVAVERGFAPLRTSGDGMSLLFSYYLLGSILGVPSGGVLAFSTWRVRGNRERKLATESLLCVLVFFALLPVALVVGMLPEFVAFMSAQ